jgi:septal ring factor EnvC (AmiA/AmiB activator)
MDWTLVSAMCAVSAISGGIMIKVSQLGAKNQEIKQIITQLTEFTLTLNRVENKVDDMAQRVSKLEGIVEIYTGWKNNQMLAGDD